jgi:DNA-binding YbaB/EbfC family protein
VFLQLYGDNHERSNPLHRTARKIKNMKMNDLMKQAQQMQKRMLEIREELANRTVEATVGGGMVTAVVNGQQEVVSLRITPEVVDPEDTEMLEDLVVAAINEALQQSQEMMSAEMSKLTGGIKIPGLP